MKKAMLMVALAVLVLAVSAIILAGIFLTGNDQRSRQTSEQVAPTSEGTQEGGTIAEGAVNTDRQVPQPPRPLSPSSLSKESRNW